MMRVDTTYIYGLGVSSTQETPEIINLRINKGAVCLHSCTSSPLEKGDREREGKLLLECNQMAPDFIIIS